MSTRPEAFFRFPPEGEPPDLSKWVLHECRGTAQRQFIVGDHAETWTWCSSCGNWWCSMLFNLRAVARLEFKEEN